MSEMIERVAMALASNDAKYSDAQWEWLSDRIQQAFRSDARAAIEAMREPTRAMTEAAHDCLAGDDGDVSDVYRAMIDAALK